MRQRKDDVCELERICYEAALPHRPGRGELRRRGRPGRYAVWSPMTAGDGNCVVDVGDDLGALLEKYHLSAERLCVLEC